MIFIGFLLISGMFFAYAHLAGGAEFFYNPDSIPIPLTAVVLFSLFTFKGGPFLRGIRCMFLFDARGYVRDPEVRDLFRSLTFVSLAAGICSTCQGLICGTLIEKVLPPASRIPFSEMLCYASFSTMYALMFSAFLLYPVHLLNKYAR